MIWTLLYLLAAIALSAWTARHRPIAKIVLFPRGQTMPTVTTDQTLPISAAAFDKAGNPTSLAGMTLTWSTSDPSLATNTVATDTLSVVFDPLKPGDVTETASITIGNTTITGTLVVTITPGAPVSLVLTPGVPA